MKNKRTVTEPLTTAEKQQFADCEATYRKCAGAPFEAGRVLEQIREGKLYREHFRSWGKYCRKKWDISRAYADRLIWFARIHRILAASLDLQLTNEFQARPLIGLPDDKIVAVGKRALTIAAGKRLTSKIVKEAVDLELSESKPPAQTKPSLAPEEISRALGHLTAAEEAADRLPDGDGKAALLKELAALRACLDRPAEPTAEAKNGHPAATPSVTSVIVPTPAEPSRGNGGPAVESVSVASNGHVHANTSSPVPTGNGSVSNGASENGHTAVGRPVGVLAQGTETPVAKWNDVPVVIANWLLDQQLPLPAMPFIKRDEAAFPRSARLRTLQDGSLIDLGDGRAQLLRKARRLLDGSGRRDLRVDVQLAGGETITL